MSLTCVEADLHLPVQVWFQVQPQAGAQPRTRAQPRAQPRTRARAEALALKSGIPFSCFVKL